MPPLDNGALDPEDRTSCKVGYRTTMNALKQLSNESIDACLSMASAQQVPFYHPSAGDTLPPCSISLDPNLEPLSLPVKHDDGKIYLWRTITPIGEGDPVAVVEPIIGNTDLSEPIAVPMALEFVRAWEKKYSLVRGRAEVIQAARQAAWKMACRQASLSEPEKLFQAFVEKKDQSHEQLSASNVAQVTALSAPKGVVSSSPDCNQIRTSFPLSGRTQSLTFGEPGPLACGRLLFFRHSLSEPATTRGISNFELGLLDVDERPTKPIVRLPPVAPQARTPWPQLFCCKAPQEVTTAIKRPASVDALTDTPEQPAKRGRLDSPERPTDLVGWAIHDAIEKIRENHERKTTGLVDAARHLLDLFDPVGSDFHCVNDALGILREQVAEFE